MRYQWHIFLAALDPTRGAEQEQTSRARRQPGTDQSAVARGQRDPPDLPKSAERVVYPNKVLLPTDVAGLRVDSIALCYQIRTLDKSRLERDWGELDDVNLRQEILDAIRFQLEM